MRRPLVVSFSSQLVFPGLALGLKHWRGVGRVIVVHCTLKNEKIQI